MNQAPVVDVRGLHVRFGEVEAVAGIDLEAYAGQATALLGRNGAGKSTTMRVLAGVIPPTGGDVLVDGVDVRTDPLAVKRSSRSRARSSQSVRRRSFALSWRCSHGVARGTRPPTSGQ